MKFLLISCLITDSNEKTLYKMKNSHTVIFEVARSLCLGICAVLRLWVNLVNLHEIEGV